MTDQIAYLTKDQRNDLNRWLAMHALGYRWYRLNPAWMDQANLKNRDKFQTRLLLGPHYHGLRGDPAMYIPCGEDLPLDPGAYELVIRYTESWDRAAVFVERYLLQIRCVQLQGDETSTYAVHDPAGQFLAYGKTGPEAICKGVRALIESQPEVVVD